MNGIHDGGERITKLVRQHREELVLAAMQVRHGLGLHPRALQLAALTDVPNVALDDGPVIHLVDVADELDLHAAAVPILERQVVIANVTAVLKLAEGALARAFVLEQTDLPQLLAVQLVPRVAQHFGNEWIGVGDLAGRGVENQNAVPRRLEQASIAKLGVPKLGLREPPVRDVLDGEQDQLADAVTFPNPARVDQHDPSANLREVVFDLEILKRTGVAPDRLEHRAQLGDVPLTASQLVDEAALRFLGRDAEGLIEGAVRRLDPEIVMEDDDRLAHGRYDALGVGERILDLPFLPPALTDVAKHQHHARDGPSCVANRSGAVIDRPFRAVLGDQQRVVGEPDDQALAQGPRGRILDRAARLFIDDLEDALQGAAGRLFQRPAGQRFRHRV